MKYSYYKNIDLSFENSERKIVDALSDVGFGILTEISLSNAFKIKLDLEFKNYKILGACNPTLAHEAVNYEEFIGILMPCNILLIDNQDNTTKVVFPIASSLLDITDNKDLLELAKKVDNLLETAFNKVS